jgi:hypothetical protein
LQNKRFDTDVIITQSENVGKYLNKRFIITHVDIKQYEEKVEKNESVSIVAIYFTVFN